MDAERLRIERARKRLTVRQLAEKAGVNPGTISELERGVREPYPATLGKIAAALEMPIEELTKAPKAQAPPSSELTFNDVLADAERREELDKLRELLADAGATTSHLALPDEEFEELWEGKAAEERAKINRELLEERQLVKPLLTRWVSLPPGSEERKQLHHLWEQVYFVRLLSMAVEKNQAAAQAEAEEARRAGDEARAAEVLEEARKFAEAA